MTPQTSADIHRDAIARKEADAIAFVALGSPADAARIRAELALMQFPGVTTREFLRLDTERNQAGARIGAAVESAGAAA